jgi:hypothetical protein
LLKFEIGFAKVIKKISDSKKPIIGHNMKFDLAFIYHQFYKELPERYEEFAESVNKHFFPVCFDTKVFSIFAAKMGKSDL